MRNLLVLSSSLTSLAESYSLTVLLDCALRDCSFCKNGGMKNKENNMPGTYMSNMDDNVQRVHCRLSDRHLIQLFLANKTNLIIILSSFFFRFDCLVIYKILILLTAVCLH